MVQEIDIRSRRQLAAAIRRFMEAIIDSDEYECRVPASADPAILGIYSEVWVLYSDLSGTRLTGKDALKPDQRESLERCVPFLEGDRPFTWPLTTPWGHLRCLALNVLTLGSWGRREREKLQRAGILDYWPFSSREEYLEERRAAGSV